MATEAWYRLPRVYIHTIAKFVGVRPRAWWKVSFRKCKWRNVFFFLHWSNSVVTRDHTSFDCDNLRDSCSLRSSKQTYVILEHAVRGIPLYVTRIYTDNKMLEKNKIPTLGLHTQYNNNALPCLPMLRIPYRIRYTSHQVLKALRTRNNREQFFNFGDL